MEPVKRIQRIPYTRMTYHDSQQDFVKFLFSIFQVSIGDFNMENCILE